jgi:hypothetical protein
MASSARRDLGLDRIGTTTRVLAVGAIALAGILSAAVAKALPGKSTHRASSTSISSGSADPAAPAGGQGTSAPSTAAPLTPPAQPPQPAIAPPVVSSGGS